MWLSYINDDQDSTNAQADCDAESKCHASVENNEKEKIEEVITILSSKTKPTNTALETNEEGPSFHKKIVQSCQEISLDKGKGTVTLAQNYADKATKQEADDANEAQIHSYNLQVHC